METFRVLVADDHEVVRLGVRSMVEIQDGWEVCGEATDGHEAVQKTLHLRPDVVILDVGMPGVNGLEAAREIQHEIPGQRILILTDTDSEQIMSEALQAGIKGFVLKSDPGRDLIAAVGTLQQGGIFFTPKMADMVLDAYLRKSQEVMPRKGEKLTLRQSEIIQLLAAGRTTKEIASILNLSVKTVETHRSNIMSKLKVHSLPELILFAIRNNIVFVPNTSTSFFLGPTDDVETHKNLGGQWILELASAPECAPGSQTPRVPHLRNCAAVG